MSMHVSRKMVHDFNHILNCLPETTLKIELSTLGFYGILFFPKKELERCRARSFRNYAVHLSSSGKKKPVLLRTVFPIKVVNYI